MSLRQFLDELDGRERSLFVVNRSAPDPVLAMLDELFERQPVSVEETTLADAESDLVLLVEDGEVVARSPLSDLETAILFVNSDLFVTGARDLDEVALPDVLAHLDDVPFRLRGYPESHHEKLLLILVSRHIERRAWSRGAGTLRASFQSLSRIDDEVGTREVYQLLDGSAVDVHLYGHAF